MDILHRGNNFEYYYLTRLFLDFYFAYLPNIISEIVSLSPKVFLVNALTPNALRVLFVLLGGTPCIIYEGNINE